jgi:hypothetical protein
MGYNYEISVRASIEPNVYRSVIDHMVNEYEKSKYGAGEHSMLGITYVWINTNHGIMYFFSEEVIQNSGSVFEHYILTTTSPLKTGEYTNIFSIQEDIVEAKENMQDFLAEVGYEYNFSLKDLDIGYTEQESPFMK